ncbi:NADPH:quinone reductase [Leifsonia sp. LS1]|uniref:NADP-dependent oxidoreductase n=1 Tax=unclassified Leifsonia TaxID=2663824 RepID=UPI001CBCB096|nr:MULTISPECIES: NADP-dependent oxidoreductase [unclassified Leifsonia]UAJ80312.1 NADP-dependent oxidoreductase [Leifsonia sp. ZF2019]GIT80787.1 NADPH:quinone reductase [Leifsonia sp. LS1]
MPKTMRAALLDAAGGPEALRVGETATPDRVNAEFLVKVVAAGVNPIDAKTRAGRGVFEAIHSFPAVLGHDFSGVVVESPYSAHPIRPGDEVFGMVMVPRFGGSFAEYISVPSLSVVRKPATLSHIEAAAAPLAALTAWGMVVEVAKAHEGQRMLIHAGSGGVGHFAVQFASYFGAHVIATASGSKASWLRSLGASEVVDYTTTRFEDAVREVDVVIDLVGNVHDDTGSRSLEVLRPGGLIVNAPTGSWPGFADEVAAAGMRGTHYKVAPDGNTLSVIARLLEAGNVRVHVDEIFALDQIADAHRAVEGGHTRGKVVVKVAEG